VDRVIRTKYVRLRQVARQRTHLRSELDKVDPLDE
jgi:hypothetical protein